MLRLALSTTGRRVAEAVKAKQLQRLMRLAWGIACHARLQAAGLEERQECEISRFGSSFRGLYAGTVFKGTCLRSNGPLFLRAVQGTCLLPCWDRLEVRR